MSTWRHDERDDLDSEIDGIWRKASREEPPPHVDAAILAAARTRRSRFATWQPLAMAAAVAGLAFLLVQLLPREPDVEQPILMEPAPPPAAPVERAESSSLDAPTAEMPPAQWAALIETLYASGDRATAAAQLRAFRVEHADADRYLPEALREWASEVR
jgi:quinol-cytochrome oxidoreductase complex cytochrome b subunit